LQWSGCRFAIVLHDSLFFVTLYSMTCTARLPLYSMTLNAGLNNLAADLQSCCMTLFSLHDSLFCMNISSWFFVLYEYLFCRTCMPLYLMIACLCIQWFSTQGSMIWRQICNRVAWLSNLHDSVFYMTLYSAWLFIKWLHASLFMNLPRKIEWSGGRFAIVLHDSLFCMILYSTWLSLFCMTLYLMIACLSIQWLSTQNWMIWR